jgi:hypothetical protein
VERRNKWHSGLTLKKTTNSFAHLASSLIAESDRQDAVSRNAPCHKVRNAVCYGFRFARSGTRNDQKGSFGIKNCLFLSFI